MSATSALLAPVPAALADRLTADLTVDGWAVTDSEGGVWYADEAASDEISAAIDPRDTACRMCAHAPMRGTWHS